MNKKTVLIVVFVLVFIVIGVVIYFTLASNKKPTSTVTQQNQEQTGLGNILANSNTGIVNSLLNFAKG